MEGFLIGVGVGIIIIGVVAFVRKVVDRINNPPIPDICPLCYKDLLNKMAHEHDIKVDRFGYDCVLCKRTQGVLP